MSERYTRVYSLSDNLYLDGAPMLIAAGALLKDNKTGRILAQLKLQNLIESKVIACKVTIRAFDTAGTELSGIESYSYLDMTVSRGQNFGAKEPITLPDSTTRRIRVSVIQAVFNNGEVWQDSIGEWTPIVPHQRIANAEVQEQYSIEVGKNCEYIPRRMGDLFLCTCGAVNLSEYTVCSGCKRDAMRLISAFDIGELTQKRDLRLQQEREREEEKRRIAAEHEAEKKRVAEITKKKVKRISVVASVCATLIVAAVLTTKYIVIPEMGYRAAEELLEAKDYNGAETAFVQLGTYRDSVERVSKDIPYLKACDSLNDGDYEKAMKAFMDLSDYKDSVNLLLEAQEKIYGTAEELLTARDYDGAINAFVQLGTYKDSAERVSREIPYLKACDSLNDGDYEQAIKGFEDLSDYKDSASLLSEAKEGYYLKAFTLLNENNLKSAYIIFQSLQSYKDSTQQMKSISDSIYADATRSCHEGRYSDALEKFNYLRENCPNIERATVNDYISYCEVRLINFDDGEIHRLDEPYSKVVSISDESLKNQLMSIPQMQMVSRLDGTWYGVHFGLQMTMFIRNGVMAEITEGVFRHDYILCFCKGEYGREFANILNEYGNTMSKMSSIFTDISDISFTINDESTKDKYTYSKNK